MKLRRDGRSRLREDLDEIEPYVSPQLPARYRLNTNESPYPPPDEVLDEIAEATRSLSLNRYPDRDASGFLDALAARLRRDPRSLWIANGSNEVFQHVFMTFGGPGRSSMTFEPTYLLHSLIPRLTGTSTIAGRRTDELSIDVGEAVDAIRERAPDVVILCSPNNPNGGIDPVDAVRVILSETDVLVIVDEAYGEFASPESSVVSLVDDHPNLLVTRTFSKAWRLAGARIGYLVAHPEIVETMARVRLPYHLSSLTQAIGSIALRHADELLESVAAVVRERDRLGLELQALGIKTYPSSANFVLFEVDDADAIWTALLERGVLVRNYAGQDGLERCLRVTAGLPEETDAFVSALRVVLGD